MKNLWFNSKGQDSTRYVWMGAPRLDTQINPDSSSENLRVAHDYRGAPNVLSPDTLAVSDQVKNVVTAEYGKKSMQQERENNSRTPGNPMGILFGAKFEQQWVNPAFWVNLTLFSKDAILKNMKVSMDSVKEMMQGSAMLSTGVMSALFNQSCDPALKAIAEGKESNLEKTDVATFDLVADAVNYSFDGALADAEIEEELGQDALKSREGFRKIRDLSFWREARHRGMLKHIKNNLNKAHKEVIANINRAKEHLRRSRDNMVNSLEMYQDGLQNRKDSVREKQFMGFVQSVIRNPEGFLRGEILGMIDLKQVFGSTNKVKILEAIKFKFADKVLDLELSQQLTLDQEARLSNMDKRSALTDEAIETTDFGGLYDALEATKVQTYEGEQIKDDASVLRTLMTGLRRMGVDVKRDIFKGAPVWITTGERMTLLLQFMAGNLGFLNDARCSIGFKRTLYTWLQEAHASQAEVLAQGAQSEAGTPAQRRYVLNNGIVVRDNANEAIDALRDIDQAMRLEIPTVINEKLQKIKTFLGSFEQFFGEDGESGELAGKIANMPRDEKDLIVGLKDYKGLYSTLKTTLESLQEQRRNYVDDVLKKLPPDDDLLSAERLRAQSIADRMSEMVGTNGNGINFSREDFEALEKSRSEIFARVQEWDDARQDLANRHFDLPATEAGFTGMRIIGVGLQHALDAIPEGDEQPATNNFNSLVGQYLLNQKVEPEREGQFKRDLSANMSHQFDVLLGRKNGVVYKAPEAGTTLAKIDVADIMHTDGELEFPDSLKNREVLNDLTLLRSAQQVRNIDGKNVVVSMDLIFHNDDYIVQIREDKKGQVIAESWEKPENIRGDRNALVMVPRTQPDEVFAVLNMSTAGTRAEDMAHAWRR